MTKEQALQNELTGTTAEVDTYPNILRAMDAYARQEAIDFRAWVSEKEFIYDRERVIWIEYDDEGNDHYVCDNDEQLYDLYNNTKGTHKNKSDVKS